MNKPLTVAVFLVLGCLVSGRLFIKQTATIEVRGVLGGPSSPSLLSNAEGAELYEPAMVGISRVGALISDSAHGLAGGSNVPAATALALVDEASIKDLGEPVGPAFDRSGTVSYAVERGDNLSRIAAYFGISIDTIVAANPGVRAKALQIGQNLKILPTSGVIYQTQPGDTLESVANLFSITQDQIMQFNRSVNFASLDPGTSIVIPGGKNLSRLAASGASLPDYNDQFIMPANGYDWGTLHHYNAVDISNSCGTPVVAAAEGLVIPDESIPDTSDGWNGGYGNFVLIEHPFGDNVRTRYAHLEKASVQIGDYVKQGQVIGLMGETGDATGCHVHFEVYGAQDPFAKS